MREPINVGIRDVSNRVETNTLSIMRHQEKQSALLMDINRMNKPNNIVYRRKNTESCTHQESFHILRQRLTLASPR
jgi:hypothetical protein